MRSEVQHPFAARLTDHVLHDVPDHVGFVGAQATVVARDVVDLDAFGERPHELVHLI
jgi:hypothetical protein